MYLNNRLRALDQNYTMIEQMFFSEAYGTKSFNINVPERAACMNAIFNDEPSDTTDSGESIKNLYGRYNDITERIQLLVQLVNLVWNVDMFV